MATKFDFIFTFKGGYAYEERPENYWRSVRGANAVSSYPAYAKAVQTRGEDRWITRYDTGADNVKDQTAVDYITRNVKRVARGDFANVGVVCVAGCSNGSALSLAVAAELEASSVRINYIGLVDLPMFAFGRSPPVPKIGDCRCSEPESGDGWMAPLLGLAAPLLSGPYSVEPLKVSVPTIKLQTELRARRKENYFQTDGQRVGLSGHWTSTMKFNEVHGAIAGWGAGNINLPQSGYGLDGSRFGDDGLHNTICRYFLDASGGKIDPKLSEALADF